MIFGHDADIAAWVSRQIPHVGGESFGPCSAIGVASEDKVIAGFVYHDYQPQYRTIQISAAAISPRWAQKGIIRAILHYPFEQLGVLKIWTATPASNKRALKLNKGLGFTQEAVLGHHFGKEHAVIFRMYRGVYEKRYKEQFGNGKENTKSARRA